MTSATPTKKQRIKTILDNAVVLFVLVLAGGIHSGCSADDSASMGSNVGGAGAQDIGVFRNILEAGRIPGPETLDANGFFSEHVIDLPPPNCEQDICLQASVAMANDWVDGTYDRIVQVALNSPIDPNELERKPMDMVVVVDTSGSMAENDKMSYVLKGLHTLVDELEPGDRMALIRYSSEVEVLVSLDSEVDATALHEAVSSLYANGSTNLYEGLQTGLQMAVDAFDKERQSRVILMSDGLPTRGVTDTTQILAMSDSYVTEGVGLTTIGVGLDFDVNLMRSLAERGSGNFYFLDDLEAIEEVFTEELDTFMTPIAHDLTIEVRTGSGYQISSVTGATFWEASNFGGSLWLPSVFLAARSTSTPPREGRRGGGSKFYLELDPTGQTGQNSDLVEVRLTYRNARDGKTYEQVIHLTDPYGTDGPIQEPYCDWPGMDKASAVLFIYKGLHRACEQAEWSYNTALAILLNLKSKAEAWQALAEDTDVAEDLRLIDLFIANLENAGAYPVEDDCMQEDGYCEGMDQDMTMCSTAPVETSWYWLAWMGMALAATSLRRRRH